MDVIFQEGLVYFQGANFFKQKTWRKMWMVLFRPTFSGVGRLELHAVLDEAAATRKRTAVKELKKTVVRLQNCISAATAPGESCPADCTAFYLTTLTCSYILASSGSQQWLRAIWFIAFQKDPGEAEGGGFTRGNEEPMVANDIYTSWKKEPALALNQYNVRVQTTEASLKCYLAGEYLVSVNPSDLVLQDLNTGETIFKWPYTCIRKFGKIKDGFSIEAGCRCESGEGVFIFKSPLGNEIYQIIIDNCILKKKSSAEPPGVHTVQTPTAMPGTPTGSSTSSSVRVCADSAKITSEYATVSFKTKQLSPTDQYSLLGMEALQWGGKEEDQLFHSLGTLNLELTKEPGIYYNWQKAKCPNPPLASGSCFSADNGYSTHEWVDEEPEGSSRSRFPTGKRSQHFRERLAKLVYKGQAECKSHSSAGLQ